MLSSRRDEEHRSAVVALDNEPLVYVFGRADVEAARRLLGDKHRRLVRQFAGDDDLLQAAPESVPTATRSLGMRIA